MGVIAICSRLGGLVLAGSLLVACGGGNGDAASPKNPSEVVDLMRSTANFDYEPFATPAELLAAVDTVVVGKVDSVTSATYDDGAEQTGGVIVTLDVTDVWKHDPEVESSKVSYVFHRPTNIPASDYADAIPQGTEVVLFGYHSESTLSSGDPGRQVYAPAPQGLMIEASPDQFLNVWGDEGGDWAGLDTIAALKAATLS